MNSSGNLTFKVRLSAQAHNYLKRADRTIQKRIAAAIETICSSPASGPNIKKLRGVGQNYRYRLGNIRIIYTVVNKERLIIINSIGPRGDVYKK